MTKTIIAVICFLSVFDAAASMEQLRDNDGSGWPKACLQAVRTFYEALSAEDDGTETPACCVFRGLDEWGKIGHLREAEMRSLVWRYIRNNKAFFMSDEAVRRGETPLMFFERAEKRFETPVTRNSMSLTVIRERRTDGTLAPLNEILLPMDGLYLPDDPRNAKSAPKIGVFGYFMTRDGRYPVDENFAAFFARENFRARVWLWFYNRRVNANKDLRGKKD